MQINILTIITRGISMFKKLLITGVLSVSALLSGCANNSDLQESVGSLSSQISDLTSRVEMLESENADMKSNIQSTAARTATALSTAEAAASEAERANARIDNIAASYSK